MEQRGCGRQGNYSIYYYRGGCMSLYMSKPIAYTQRMTPSVNYGLWVIMLCQYRCIDFSIYTSSLVWGVDCGGGCAWIGVVYRNSLYFSLNFVVNLKLL